MATRGRGDGGCDADRRRRRPRAADVARGERRCLRDLAALLASLPLRPERHSGPGADGGRVRRASRRGLRGGVRRVLDPRGVVWLNLGDTYVQKDLQGVPGGRPSRCKTTAGSFAPRSSGEKPNVRPESAKDRTTRDFEHVFLLAGRRDHRFYRRRDPRARRVGALGPPDITEGPPAGEARLSSCPVGRHRPGPARRPWPQTGVAAVARRRGFVGIDTDTAGKATTLTFLSRGSGKLCANRVA